MGSLSSLPRITGISALKKLSSASPKKWNKYVHDIISAKKECINYV
jgi:hypothetical protein